MSWESAIKIAMMIIGLGGGVLLFLVAIISSFEGHNE